MKLLFFQITNKHTKPYSDLCVQMNKSYCDLHGYHFLEIESAVYDGYHYTWSKIFTSIDLLKTTDYDYYFFLDADAAVINKNIKLESLINRMKHNISFSENGCNGPQMVATGAFLFNKKALPLFELCINLANSDSSHYKQNYFFEMSIIDNIYKNKQFDMDVFEMNTMNSTVFADHSHPLLETLFIYHFQGRGDEEKARIGKEVYQRFFKENK